jgi:hypothetical protein
MFCSNFDFDLPAPYSQPRFYFFGAFLFGTNVSFWLAVGGGGRIVGNPNLLVGI